MKKIKLTQGKFALVDDEDYEELIKYSWSYFSGGAIAYIGGGRKNSTLILMHRMIMHPPQNMQCDHIDHDRLNNQKNNLRICLSSENSRNKTKSLRNKSGYKGVSYRRNGWRSVIVANGVQYYLGDFDNKIDAAKAYNDAAIKYHGKFACINLFA